MKLLQREPVLVLVIAAVLVAVGIDAAELAESVVRIVQAIVVVTGAAVARQRVTPVVRDDDETPPAS